MLNGRSRYVGSACFAMRWEDPLLIYFSGTGNTRKAAEIVAETNADELVDLGAKYKADDYDLIVRQGDALGIAFPVYRWSTPRIVDEFFRRARFITDDGRPYKPDYAYALGVYGYFPGSEIAFLESIMAERFGLSFDATFGIPSVANCIYVSNPPDPAKQAEGNAREEAAAKRAAKLIADRESVREGRGTLFGRLLSKATGTQSKSRPIGQFRVKPDRCISCKTCVRICPTNTISLRGGRPTWAGGDCTECLACIHRCPEEAIEYGRISEGRRRYVNPILEEGSHDGEDG